MTYRRFTDGTPISLLGFGIMRMPPAITGRRVIDRDKGAAMVDYALDQGINYFDTAYNYHGCTSEEFTGWALSRHPRERFNLATKMPIWMLNTRAEMAAIFEEQLKKCRVEYIDFYLIHNFSSKTLEKEKELGVYNFLREKKREGRIRRLGFSMHDTVRIVEQTASLYDWDFAQLQINFMDWEGLDARSAYEALGRRGIPVIVMEPLRGGALTELCEESRSIFKAAEPEKSIASWGLRFAASLPNVLTVLSGMSNLDQIKDNAAAMSPFVSLREADYAIIGKALDAYRRSAAIPCTACRYCMDCPFGVDIPENFAIYNRHHAKGKTVYLGIDYRVLGEKRQARHCTGCGRCAKLCPQGLDIPALLEKVAVFAAENALEDIRLLRPEEGVTVIGGPPAEIGLVQ
jgi:predicted aldo/keto reductase-like oxidoreductase